MYAMWVCQSFETMESFVPHSNSKHAFRYEESHLDIDSNILLEMSENWAHLSAICLETIVPQSKHRHTYGY